MEEDDSWGEDLQSQQLLPKKRNHIFLRDANIKLKGVEKKSNTTNNNKQNRTEPRIATSDGKTGAVVSFFRHVTHTHAPTGTLSQRQQQRGQRPG